MKRNFLRSMAVLMTLCVSLMASAAIDWSTIDFLGDGAGNGTYTNKYKVAVAEGMTVVNIQKPEVAAEAGIYCTFPGAVTNCSVAHFAQGAGAVIYLSAFTAQETEVTVTHATGTSVFTVYYADGTTGGNVTPEPVNLALNKTVVAGHEVSNQTAAMAVDGNLGSRWASSGGKHYSAENPDEAEDWLYVDLGQAYNIGKVRISFETAAPYDYDLLYSNDAQTWTVMGTYTEQPLTGVQNFNTYNFTADKISARYIKIFARDGFQNLAYGISIYELEVYEAITDNEKPVLTDATIDKIEWNQVLVNLTATDNIGITACKVVDADNNIDAAYPVKNNVLTINKLVGGKTYNFTINAMDDAGNISDKAITLPAVETPAHDTKPQTAAPAPTVASNLVLSIYSDAYSSTGYNFADWGGGYAETKDAVEGDNYNLYSATTLLGYLGMEITGGAINAAAMLYWHLDIWAEYDMAVQIFPIDGKAESFVSVPLKGQEWNSIDLNLSDYKTERNWANVYQIKLAGMAGKTIAVDNIYFYRDPIEDEVAPTDVKAEVATAFCNIVSLNCSATDENGVVSFDVFNGETKLATKGGLSGEIVNIAIRGLEPSTDYEFTIVASDANDNKADAVKLSVTTAAMPAPAPAPTAPAEEVLSLFSDAYDFAPASLNSYNEGWYHNPNMDIVELAEGDQVLLYGDNLLEDGVIGWEFAPIDATGYNRFHIDIYPWENVTLTVGPTYGGAGLATAIYKETRNMKGGEWTSIDVNLSGKDLSSMFQFQIVDYAAALQLFVDNAYFYKVDDTALQNPTVQQTAQKYIINGQLVIVRDGIRYNALGQVIE